MAISLTFRPQNLAYFVRDWLKFMGNGDPNVDDNCEDDFEADAGDVDAKIAIC